jgi:hypothetical protein
MESVSCQHREISGADAAGLSFVILDIERYALADFETFQAGSQNDTDMAKYIAASNVWSYEAVAVIGFPKLNCAESRHDCLFPC